LTASNVTAKDYVIAIGGGTVTDLSAFVAQVLLRGVPLVLIPTTLLAQVDAAIGGKNGLNINGKKSRIGSFYFPELVICDFSFLSTLPERQIRSGIAEMIKVFAVSDVRSFMELAAPEGNLAFDDFARWGDLVMRSIQDKVKLLAEDPFENSPRRLLNFGHTFAHFLEEESNFALTHGEGVMLSMLCEAKMGQLAHFSTADVFEALFRVIAANMTDACREFSLRSERVAEAMTTIRQLRDGHDHLVVLPKLGAGTVVPDVPDTVAITAWDAVSQRIRKLRG
jgi:3-dehydroquinate synthase